MDLDKALLYAIMSDPVKNARLLRDRAVSEDMLFGEGKVGIEFFTDYVRRYGEFPTQEIVEGKLGIQLDTGTPVPAEFLIDEIFKRRLYYGLKSGLDSCYKLLEAQDPEGAYTEFSELFRLLRKQATTTGGDRPESLTSLGGSVIEEYDRIKAGETGILTPWQGVNDATSGFWAQDLVLFVARMATGKSFLLTLLSHYMWQSGKRILFATTEMSKRTIARRWYAIHCKLPYRELRKSQLSIYQEEAMRAEYDRIKEDDRIQVVGGDFDFTMDNLEAAVDDTEPDVLFVDGAYLLKTAGFDRRERSANAFDELKRLANRKKIPIILTLQFNREVKGNSADTVQASSIAQTDVAGWNADVIYGMWQSDDMKADKRMRLINLKTREGAGTDVEIRWDLDRMEFGEIPQITDGGGGGEADEYGTGIDPSVDTSDLPF